MQQSDLDVIAVGSEVLLEWRNPDPVTEVVLYLGDVAGALKGAFAAGVFIGDSMVVDDPTSMLSLMFEDEFGMFKVEWDQLISVKKVEV